MLAVLGAFMLGGAVFTLIFNIQSAALRSAAEDRLDIELETTEGEEFVTPFYIKVTKAFCKGYYLEFASSFWDSKKILHWKNKLISAGLIKNIHPNQFVASKFYLTIFISIFMLLYFLFGSGEASPLVLIGVCVFIFFYPNMHVNELIKKRQVSIRLAMPYVVDLLTLSTEAGLDFIGSMGKVVDRSPPSPLIDEFAEVLKDIQLGKTRAEALRDMSSRINMNEIQSFSAVLISADRMGASIGTVLRAQSDLMRTSRLNKAEKMAAEASQKIIIPLIFFIMPAVMLMIFGPVILDFMGVK